MSPSRVLSCLFLLLTFRLIRELINIFLVKGISNKKPKMSVIKPGIINNNAAIAIDAPENIS